ncbi:hypothetical protein [Ekhidna sp.]
MKFLLSLLFVGIVYTASAQNEYLVTLNGDTITGKIEIYRDSHYDGIDIKNDEGKKTYKAFQVQSLAIDSEIYEPINYRNRKAIGKVISKGNLTYYLAIPENETTFKDRIFYKDGNAFQISAINFKKRAAEFLNDCPEVSAKIENKELKFGDLDQIVAQYNECEDSQPESVSNNISSNDLANFAQLLLDISSKVENGEDVPSYMIKALEEYSQTSLDQQVQSLLSELKKN